jgi:hypothetical protein
MVYETQNYWVLGLCPSSGMDLFPSSCEGRETITLLGLLERGKLNHYHCLEFPMMDKVLKANDSEND